MENISRMLFMDMSDAALAAAPHASLSASSAGLEAEPHSVAASRFNSAAAPPSTPARGAKGAVSMADILGQAGCRSGSQSQQSTPCSDPRAKRKGRGKGQTTQTIFKTCRGCQLTTRHNNPFNSEERVPWAYPDGSGEWCRNCDMLHRARLKRVTGGKEGLSQWLQTPANRDMFTRLFVAWVRVKNRLGYMPKGSHLDDPMFIEQHQLLAIE